MGPILDWTVTDGPCRWARGCHALGRATSRPSATAGIVLPAPSDPPVRSGAVRSEIEIPHSPVFSKRAQRGGRYFGFDAHSPVRRPQSVAIPRRSHPTLPSRTIRVCWAGIACRPLTTGPLPQAPPRLPLPLLLRPRLISASAFPLCTPSPRTCSFPRASSQRTEGRSRTCRDTQQLSPFTGQQRRPARSVALAKAHGEEL